MAQTPEERAVVSALGESGKRVVELVNAKTAPIASLTEWRNDVDENLNRFNAHCDKAREAQRTKATKPQAVAPLLPSSPTPARDAHTETASSNRSWGGVALLLAFAFAIVTLLIFISTYNGFFPDKPDALRVVVIMLIIAFSFAIGGFFGSKIDGARSPKTARAVEGNAE